MDMDNINRVKAALSAALGLLTALWGWFGWLVIAWIGAMVIDYLTGTAAAMKDGEWASETARNGLWHKAGCVAAVAIAGILDLVIGQLLGNMGDALPFHYSVMLCPLVVTWYILTEAGSIVENAGKMGAPVPKWLKSAIALFRTQVDTVADPAGEEMDGDHDKSGKSKTGQNHI